MSKALRPKKETYAPARADLRPQFYDLTGEEKVQCLVCLRNGITAAYGRGQAFMSDPANPPPSASVGDAHMVCHGHIPENSVIFDPMGGECRNKAGDESWKE